MIVVVERPLEAFENIDHLRETRPFERLAGVKRTMAATADEQHRPRQVAAQKAFDLAGELGIDVPVRRLLPGNMLGANRMTDVHVLDFSPAVDQHGLRIGFQKSVCGEGIKVLHRCIGRFGKGDIMKASSTERKLKPYPRLEMT